jgi:hypothetical protein
VAAARWEGRREGAGPADEPRCLMQPRFPHRQGLSDWTSCFSGAYAAWTRVRFARPLVTAPLEVEDHDLAANSAHPRAIAISPRATPEAQRAQLMRVRNDAQRTDSGGRTPANNDQVCGFRPSA